MSQEGFTSAYIRSQPMGKTPLIVVPDQFVFETEKALFRKCSEHGRTELFPNIRVLTIARVSDDIVTKFTVEKPPADDITKAVIMYNAVRNRGVQLNALGKIARKPGFASKMVKTVSLFKTAGIDCAKLGDSLEEENFTLASPSLLEKSRIYTRFIWSTTRCCPRTIPTNSTSQCAPLFLLRRILILKA